MPKASSLTLEGNLSFLFKGPPGFGKTIAACSFAALGPIYLAYFDKNRPVELLTFFKKHRPELLDNIEYDIYGAVNCNEYLNKLIKMKQDCRYVAVITDSLTQLTASAVNWSMAYREKKKGSSSQVSENNQILPDWDEYKVETSLIAQAIDIGKGLPTNVIWTAHPLPSTKIDSQGSKVVVTKTNSLVTYGSKVAGMIPGNFTEIYHFYQQSDYDSVSCKSTKKTLVSTESMGDEMAKSALGLTGSLDITDKLFYEEWKKQLALLK